MPRREAPIKLLIGLLLLALFLGAQTKTKEAPYDPDKLPPGEKACGRKGAKNNQPCECMRHRLAAADEQLLLCQQFSDKGKRRACMAEADACKIHPNDVDDAGNEDGTGMPQQCSRSCSKAKCECCRT